MISKVRICKQVLKSKLQQKFRHQVCHYDCQVDGVDSSTGREKVTFVLFFIISVMFCLQLVGLSVSRTAPKLPVNFMKCLEWTRDNHIFVVIIIIIIIIIIYCVSKKNYTLFIFTITFLFMNQFS